MKKFFRSLSIAALTLGSAVAHAQDAYPDKPVKMVVGYPPGGTLDIVGRLLANELQKDLKQQFIIENRAGAGGIVGAQGVARASADGYTLLMAIGSHTVLPAIKGKMPYDTLEDFTPIAMVGTSPNMLVVRSDHPAKTLKDFLQQARQASMPVNYGTPGIGTTTHVTAVMVERSAELKLNHIPFKGSADTQRALLAGDVPVAFGSIVSNGAAIRDGRIRSLAIVGDERSSLLPDVPTFEEGGVKNVLGNNWLGLLAPAGTPKAVIDKVHTTIASISARPAFQESLKSQGVQPQLLGPAQFDKLLRNEVAAYEAAAKASNLKVE